MSGRCRTSRSCHSCTLAFVVTRGVDHERRAGAKRGDGAGEPEQLSIPGRLHDTAGNNRPAMPRRCR